MISWRGYSNLGNDHRRQHCAVADAVNKAHGTISVQQYGSHASDASSGPRTMHPSSQQGRLIKIGGRDGSYSRTTPDLET